MVGIVYALSPAEAERIRQLLQEKVLSSPDEPAESISFHIQTSIEGIGRMLGERASSASFDHLSIRPIDEKIFQWILFCANQDSFLSCLVSESTASLCKRLKEEKVPFLGKLFEERECLFLLPSSFQQNPSNEVAGRGKGEIFSLGSHERSFVSAEAVREELEPLTAIFCSLRWDLLVAFCGTTKRGEAEALRAQCSRALEELTFVQCGPSLEERQLREFSAYMRWKILEVMQTSFSLAKSYAEEKTEGPLRVVDMQMRSQMKRITDTLLLPLPFKERILSPLERTSTDSPTPSEERVNPMVILGYSVVILGTLGLIYALYRRGIMGKLLSSLPKL